MSEFHLLEQWRTEARSYALTMVRMYRKNADLVKEDSPYRRAMREMADRWEKAANSFRVPTTPKEPAP